MKRVLFVAPCFAPSSYPPALRNRLLAMHLKAFGWEPTVLTVEPRWMTEPQDLDFLAMIPSDLDVVRTRALPEAWTRLAGIGNLSYRAFGHQLSAAAALCRNRKPDLLFISGPPWISFLIGALIRRRFGVPYVLDYTDPWVEKDPPKSHFFQKRFWADRMAEALDPIAVSGASAIVSVSEETNRFLRERYPRQAARVREALPMGFEAGDFDRVRAHPPRHDFFSASDGLRHVAYVGVVWKAAYGTFEAFFEALGRWKRRDPRAYAGIRWHFIGTSYDPTAPPQVLPMAARHGVEDAVRERVRRVSYLVALALLSQADALLGVGSPVSGYEPSKIFPCLLARKPILAMYHEQSMAVRILREAGLNPVTFSTERPVAQRLDRIEEAIAELASGRALVPRPNIGAGEAYSARSIAGRLASVFDAAAENPR